MQVQLACIVEGHGEISAVPVLLRRMAAAIGSHIELQIPHPVRFPRSKLPIPGELEKAVELATAKVAPSGGLLILMDADDDCPATMAPDLLARALATRSDLPIAVVLPRREFESWFLAAAESLRGRFKLPQDVKVPSDPEAIRGAKEWLKDRLANGNYSPAVDQPALAAIFDLQQARVAPSFDKLWREMERLLAVLGGSQTAEAPE
ncbi:MAG: DUF4276 family protein [Acidobacteria bacterium]|nr:DUF4276 family protein [Acidobacteriota bacterium]